MLCDNHIYSFTKTFKFIRSPDPVIHYYESHRIFNRGRIGRRIGKYYIYFFSFSLFFLFKKKKKKKTGHRWHSQPLSNTFVTFVLCFSALHSLDIRASSGYLSCSRNCCVTPVCNQNFVSLHRIYNIYIRLERVRKKKLVSDRDPIYIAILLLL